MIIIVLSMLILSISSMDSMITLIFIEYLSICLVFILIFNFDVITINISISSFVLVFERVLFSCLSITSAD